VAGEDTGAAVITGAEEGSFARSVLAERHPALIRQVREATAYPPEQQRRLDALLEEIAGGVVAPLPAGSHDADRWAEWGREHVGRPWYEVPFLWAESYFYRRLLDAVGYFGPGAWQGIDPFGPFKRAELSGPEVEEELAALDEVAAMPPEEQDRALLTGALWGNRADLGFRFSSRAASHSAADPGSERVIADDSDALWRHLRHPRPPGGHAAPAGPAPATVCVLTDNAGRELIPDLLLADHLLQTCRAAAVALHVKPYPYFVSDATTADVADCLRRIAQAPGHAGRVGARLREAVAHGRLTVRAHPFACAPLPYADMPDDLRAELAAATLTIAKGDLNYRRLVGDRTWPATTPFARLTSYFPGPLVALRTMKCDVAVGLDPRTVAGLDASGRTWRTSGAYAVIHFSSP
jgi:hypothetical protein